VVSIKPNDEVNPAINVSDHRALPEKSNDREKLLIFAYMLRDSNLHLLARNFLAARSVLSLLEDL